MKTRLWQMLVSIAKLGYTDMMAFKLDCLPSEKEMEESFGICNAIYCSIFFHEIHCI